MYDSEYHLHFIIMKVSYLTVCLYFLVKEAFILYVCQSKYLQIIIITNSTNVSIFQSLIYPFI